MSNEESDLVLQTLVYDGKLEEVSSSHSWGVFFPHISYAFSRLTQVRHQVMALTSSNGASGGGGKVYKVSFMVADEVLVGAKQCLLL